MTSPTGSPRRIAALGTQLAEADARLVGADARRAARWVAAATAMGGGAAVVAVAATACLVAAIVLGLATVMPAWLAAVLTGAALLAVAALLAILAREAAKDAGGALRRAGERAREEGRWIGKLISSNEK
jgi:hypothetical protein